MTDQLTPEPDQATSTDTVVDPTPQVDTQQQAGDNPAKFAGKYDTPEALEQATHQVREKLGLPKIENKALFGKDGIYSDVTAAEQGYKDLEAMLGRAPKPAEAESGESTTPDQLQVKDPEPSDPFEAVQQELSSKGMDDAFQRSISETYMKDGKLTDEQYKTLQEKGGYSKAVVDAHLTALSQVAQTTAKTQQAQVQQAIDKASQTVGGDDKLQGLLKWAGTHYTDEAEKADLNRRLADPALLQSAVQQIASAQRAAVGAGNAQPLLDNTQTAGGAPTISTHDEYQQVFKRAQQGDQQAVAALLKLDDNKFAALATGKL